MDMLNISAILIISRSSSHQQSIKPNFTTDIWKNMSLDKSTPDLTAVAMVNGLLKFNLNVSGVVFVISATASYVAMYYSTIHE